MASPFKKLQKAMAHAMSTSVNKKYRLDEYLHYSSLPFCALKKMWETLEKGGFQAYEDMQFGMRYYTSVGTTVHDGIQEYMSMLGASRDGFKAGSLGAVVGNYECEACGAKYPFSSNPFCKACGAQMKYNELSVRWGDNVIGHSDGLYMYEVKPKRYIVIDYKTTSSKAIWVHHNRGPIFPYQKNVSQIEAYTVSIEEQYGIEVDGWALLYMARDNPMAEGQTVICGELLSDKRKLMLRKRMRKADRHWPIMLAVEGNEDERLDTLIAQKPCKTPAAHDRLLGDGPYDQCPLYGVCFDETKLRKKLGKALRENEDLLPLRKNLQAQLKPPK